MLKQRSLIRRTNHLWLLLLMTLFLYACQRLPTFGNVDLENLRLLDEGPCWKSACPGKTSLEDAFDAFLQQDIFVTPLELEYVRSRNEVYVYFGPEHFGSNGVHLEYADQAIIRRIMIEFNSGLTLSQIIDYFGSPTRTLMTADCVGDIAHPLYSFNLWYQEQGVSVSTYGYSSDSATSELLPQPQILISRVIYHPADVNLEKWVQIVNIDEMGKRDLNEIYQNLYPWRGWEHTVPSFVRCR